MSRAFATVGTTQFDALTSTLLSRELLETLRGDGREVWIDGERVADVTADPRFAGAARTLAELYDMPEEDGDLSYTSPTKGDSARLCWMDCVSAHDLGGRSRRELNRHVARSL